MAKCPKCGNRKMIKDKPPKVKVNRPLAYGYTCKKCNNWFSEKALKH